MDTSTIKPHFKEYLNELPPYSVSIGTDSSSLMIQICQNVELPRRRYKAAFTQDKLLQQSKWFILFDSPDSIAAEINVLLTEGNYKIQEETDSVRLYLLIQTHPIEEIPFALPLLEAQSSNLIEDICHSLKQMNTVLSSHCQMFDLISYTSLYEQALKKSNTLTSGELFTDGIKSLIGSLIWKDKPIQYALLYSATIDNSTLKDLHQHCDDKGATLVIIQTTGGSVFGAYISESLKISNKPKADSLFFMFSVTLNKVYKSMDGSSAIFSKESLSFGNGSIVLSPNFTKGNKNSTGLKTPSGYSNPQELNGGKKKFTVKKLEVYQVIIKD